MDHFLYQFSTLSEEMKSIYRLENCTFCKKRHRILIFLTLFKYKIYALEYSICANYRFIHVGTPKITDVTIYQLDHPISIKFHHVLEIFFVLHHGCVALLCYQNKVLLSLMFIEFIEPDLYNR